MTKTRSPIGWGYLEDRLEDKQRERLLPAIQMFLGGELAEHRPPPDDADVAILRAKLTPPDSLREVMATDHASALLHAAGRSFRDRYAGSARRSLGFRTITRPKYRMYAADQSANLFILATFK